SIDRKDFGIVYPGMKDDLIKDEVLLDLNLVFPRS
ncbi:MAG: YceI family protein, partial [Deltaproteobacteria bacterium]